MKKLIVIIALMSILIGCSNTIEESGSEEVYTVGKEVDVKEELPESENTISKTNEDEDEVTQSLEERSTASEEVNDKNTETEESKELEEKKEDTPQETSDVSQIELSKTEVYWLQESLKLAGFYTALDGSFGPNTKAQLKAFKESHADLSDDAIFSAPVKEKLEVIRKDKMIENADSRLILLNKSNYLSYKFIPKNLVEAELPKSKVMMLRSDVNAQAKAMFEEALKYGHNLYMASGYRSYDYQETLFSRRVKNYGFEAAEKVVAVPGQSEHQTGLAIDITTAEMGYGLSQSFDQTESFKWLENNCYRYGFILRYQKGKEDLTGYIYEPWHYRYIGDIEMAKEIMEQGLVLEEYFN